MIRSLRVKSYALNEVDKALKWRAALGNILTYAECHPLLYLLIAHFCVQILHMAETATKYFSALAGIISVPLNYTVRCKHTCKFFADYLPYPLVGGDLIRCN